MTYQQTLDYLFSRLPMYQREGVAAYKADIGNIVAASRKLGGPHKKFKSIHIAGTNGKGSVSHMLASILQEAGYKVGLYTSPHLKDFRERIKINGEMITEKEVVGFVKKNKVIFEKMQLSFFEFTVVMAFDYFAKQKVEIAIIEVGLGGRLDSTNIINPELSIITNIGLDHTNLLGDTLEEIAVEKAGIIKKNTPIIIGRKQKETIKVFRNIAQENDAELIYASEKESYKTDLEGIYQKENRNTCLTAIESLQNMGWRIPESSIKKGLANTIKNTSLLGRWQLMSTSPATICDIGHNEDGIKQICRQLKNIKYDHLHFVYGTVNDKSLNEILTLLPKDAKYYFCRPNIARGLDEIELQEKADNKGLKGKAYSGVKEALETANKNATKDDLIFVGGSAFVVAEVI
jgi:dihydrofolate synthase / folylpolyglutamate synthase